MKLDTIKFALSGGIIVGLCFSFTTIASLTHIPGFLPFGKLLVEGYGFYGYSLSWTGVLMGALWGCIEGFFWFGLFGLIYNKLVK